MKQLQIKHIKHKVRFYSDARVSINSALLNLIFLFFIDHRSLQEIVENAVNKAMKEKPFEVISVSKLSGTKMNKIEKTMGFENIRVCIIIPTKAVIS